MKKRCQPHIRWEKMFKLRPEPAAKDSRTLVAYFSCTGTTERIAGMIAEQTGAELYEITPEIPYTQADLNYGDSSSRATVEQREPSARPAITGEVDDMGKYDTIFLGYPIWHGQAPRIICTFLESYDFSGKTVVPFSTSHSSGIGSSDANLHSLCPDTVTWTKGWRFSADTTRGNVEEWIDSMEITASADQDGKPVFPGKKYLSRQNCIPANLPTPPKPLTRRLKKWGWITST